MQINNKLMNWLLFAILSLIWGSSFILMKAGMTKLSPYQVAGLRMFSAGLVLLPVAYKQFRNIPRDKIGVIFLSGLLGSFFPAFLFCIAETRIDSSLAGILNALTPLFAIMLGAFFFQARVSAQKIAGVLIGLAGLILLFASKGDISLKDISYASLVLVATICYGINVNMVSRSLKEVGSVNIASFAFGFLLVPALAILYFTGYFRLDFAEKSVLLSTLAASVLGIAGTAFASILFYMLVKRAGTVFSTLVTYGIPFVAVGWGLYFGEKINLLQVACLGIILAGVYLSSRKSKSE